MRQLFAALGTAVSVTVGAQAAAICATPAEMKALQAAVLEQQLAAAAQSCRATEDYARFVATYRDAIVKADQKVRAFFRHQTSGEGYGGYKSRIAHDIALKSLHDPKFCSAAKTVFDLALGRGKPSEPPILVETGYEGCRPLPQKPIMAATPRPLMAPAVKAAPVAPSELVSAPPVWNADRILALLRPTGVPIPTPAPPHAVRALALAHPAPKPEQRPIMPKPRLAIVPLPKPVVAPHRAVLAAIGVPPVPPMREAHQEIRHPAAAEQSDADQDSAGNVPNAYRPGAQWIGAEAPSGGRFDEAPSRMYRGPDGRWYVRIGHHDRWNDDEDE